MEQLEAKGRSKSHIQTVEAHGDVTRLLIHLRRAGLAPKTARNILSALDSM